METDARDFIDFQPDGLVVFDSDGNSTLIELPGVAPTQLRHAMETIARTLGTWDGWYDSLG